MIFGDFPKWVELRGRQQFGDFPKMHAIWFFKPTLIQEGSVILIPVTKHISLDRVCLYSYTRAIPDNPDAQNFIRALYHGSIILQQLI